MGYNDGMKMYLLWMILAAGVGVIVAGVCKLGFYLMSNGRRKKKLSFGALVKQLFRLDGMPIVMMTVLTALTLLAHEATYAGSSMYAGYNLGTTKAIPFFILLVIDIIAVIWEIVGFVSNKTIRKNRAIGIIVGIILGAIVAIFALKIFVNLGFPVPWGMG